MEIKFAEVAYRPLELMLLYTVLNASWRRYCCYSTGTALRVL